MGERFITMRDIPNSITISDLKIYFKNRAKEIQQINRRIDRQIYDAKIIFGSSIIATGVYRRYREKDLFGTRYNMELSSLEGNDEENSDDIIGKTIGDYIFRKKIGSGGFGNVYLADDINGKVMVAIKVDKDTNKHSRLQQEWEVYCATANKGGARCLAYFKSEGIKYLVMPFYGLSVGEYTQNNVTVEPWRVFNVGYQMLMAIKKIHECGYVHRDIKPDNFVLGRDQYSGNIYLIDLGLAKSYVDDNGNHIEYRKDRGINGTIRYMSIRANKGYEHSRRDDLESMIYVLSFLLTGTLPWKGIHAQSKTERNKAVLKKKMVTPISEITGGNEELMMLLNSIRNLKFTEEPDYLLYSQLLLAAYKKYKSDANV